MDQSISLLPILPQFTAGTNDTDGEKENIAESTLLSSIAECLRSAVDVYQGATSSAEENHGCLKAPSQQKN